MAFNFFKRMRVKKSQPREVRDYYHSMQPLGGVSGTAFSCVDRIASEFAMLNYAVYDTAKHEKIKAHSIYELLKTPNAEDQHFNFFYQSAVDYFEGGCYWLKVRYAGEVVSLFRLNPHQVHIRRNYDNKRIFTYNGAEYTEEQVVFIPARYDFSTLTGGRSIYDAAHSTFETAASVDSFTQSSFTNGVIGKRMVIDVSGAFPDITAEQAKAVKDSFQNEYSGISNAGRPILKKKGIDYSELGTSGASDNQAAELTEARKFQEREVAKLFGVPTELLTGSINQGNLENAFTMFSEFAVRPMATQFQEAINGLLGDDCYFEFDFNGITKVSLASRIDAEIKQINNGLLSLDEARHINNLGPIEAGDTHFMPVNMMPWTEEIKEAYMAKQKKEAQSMDPTDEDTQHIPQGDDKQ